MPAQLTCETLGFIGPPWFFFPMNVFLTTISYTWVQLTRNVDWLTCKYRTAGYWGPTIRLSVILRDSIVCVESYLCPSIPCSSIINYPYKIFTHETGEMVEGLRFLPWMWLTLAFSPTLHSPLSIVPWGTMSFAGLVQLIPRITGTKQHCIWGPCIKSPAWLAKNQWEKLQTYWTLLRIKNYIPSGTTSLLKPSVSRQETAALYCKFVWMHNSLPLTIPWTGL